MRGRHGACLGRAELLPQCELALGILLAGGARGSRDRGLADKERAAAEKHVASCEECRARLEHLRGEAGRQAASCRAAREMLPLYLDAELSGGDAEELYPQVQVHLDSCRRCARFLDDLRFALTAERTGQSPEPAVYPQPSLPFLPAESRPASPLAGQRQAPQEWAIEVVRDAAARLALSITISIQYIEQILTPRQLAWARAAGQPVLPEAGESRFPLVVSMIDEESLLVTVEARKSAAESGWDLLVTLAGAESGAAHRVTASDGAETRTAIANPDGEALLADVPLAWLSTEEAGEAGGQLYFEVVQVTP